MIVFDLPRAPGASTIRAASFGSCRVTDPLFVLRSQGDLRIRAWGMAAHHTATEALQTIEVITGDRQIPDDLSPFVFETETPMAPGKLAPLVRQGIEIYILEVSSDRQFSFRDICLQQNFVARGLIQAHGRAILLVREICRGKGPDEACVALVQENLRQAGTEPSGLLIDLLREVRLEFQSVDQVTAALAAAMARVGGAWIVVGPAIIQSDHGAVMQDRRALSAKVTEAAERCGASFYDPTELLDRHGREAVLDENGANIYEYPRSYYPVVGETLVSLAQRRAPQALGAKSRAPARARAGARRLYGAAVEGLRALVGGRRAAAELGRGHRLTMSKVPPRLNVPLKVLATALR